MEYIYTDGNYANNDSLEYIENYTGKVAYQNDTNTYYFFCTNAKFRIDISGKIFWNSGIFESGDWIDGTWDSGTWNSGTWYGGTWNNGTWNSGIIYKITWIDGTFNDGLFGAYKFINYSTSNECNWNNGTFNGGVFNGDIWRNGNWNSGNWFGGNWLQGYNNGVFVGTPPLSIFSNSQNLNYFNGYIQYLYFKNNEYKIKNFECEGSNVSIDYSGKIILTNGTVRNGFLCEVEANQTSIISTTLEDGNLINCTISNSIINGGTLSNCFVSNCTWNSGNLIDSEISDSIWNNGVFTNSIFKKGTWNNGLFSSGNWYTYNSMWYDGEWITGEIDDIASNIAPYINGNGNYFLSFTGKLKYIYNGQIFIIKCIDAILSIDVSGNITWEDGTLENSTWNNGTWNNGTFENSIWNNGTWNEGSFINSTWNSGTWNSGTWNNGTWNGGVWNNGTWNNGTWNNGTWNSGIWNNGTWNYGNWFTLYSLWFGGTWNGGFQNGEIVNGELQGNFNSNILKTIIFENDDLDNQHQIKYTLSDLGLTKSTEIFIIDNNGEDATNQINNSWENGIFTIVFSDNIVGFWKINYYFNIENKITEKSFDNSKMNQNNEVIFSLFELDIQSSTEINILDNNNDFIPTKQEENYTGNDFVVTYFWNSNKLFLKFHQSFTGIWKIQYYKNFSNQNHPRLNIIDENTLYYDKNNSLYSFTGEFRYIVQDTDGTTNYFPIKVKNAQFILEQNGFIKWYNGDFEDGIWNNGIWNVFAENFIDSDENFEINENLNLEFDTNDNSIFCVWKKGTWNNGDWYYSNSTWESGTWISGKIDNITSHRSPNFMLGNGKSFENYNGEIVYHFESSFYNFFCENAKLFIEQDGKINFESGTWVNGTWNNGTWNGIAWLDGIWNNGTWNCGHWMYGTWNGGTWVISDRYYFVEGAVSTIKEQGTYKKIGEKISYIPPSIGFFEEFDIYNSYLLNSELNQSILVENDQTISSSSSESSECEFESSSSSESSGETGELYDIKFWAKSSWHDGFIGDVKSYYPPIYEEGNGKSYSGYNGTLLYKVKIYENDILKYWQYYKIGCVSAIVSFNSDGYIIWNYGSVVGGTWIDGTFKNGEWYGEEWIDGTWENGTWNSGIWNDGTWNSGRWITTNSTWNSGAWTKGYIDGIFSEMSPKTLVGNGVYLNNYNGYINYKVLINELNNVYRYYWINVSNAYLSIDNNGYILWHRGVMKNGTWYNGIWKNQYIDQETWKDTNYINSIWENGVFLNGTWENGNWIDGEWYVDENGHYTSIWKTGYINNILSSVPPIFDFVSDESLSHSFLNYSGRIKYKCQSINSYNELKEEFLTIYCKDASFEITYKPKTKQVGSSIINYKEPYIGWESGTWESGTWNNGIWKSGIWNNGTWNTGNWIDGTWNNGTFVSGMWYNGIWRGGTAKNRKNLNIFLKRT